MLITHYLDREVPAIVLTRLTPDTRQKLQILDGMPAADDALSPTLYGKGQDDLPRPYIYPKKKLLPGV